MRKPKQSSSEAHTLDCCHIRKQRQPFVTLPMAGLDGESEQETVTLTKAMANATRKRKERGSKQSDPWKGRPSFFHLCSDFCNTSTLFWYMYIFHSAEIAKWNLRGEKKITSVPHLAVSQTLGLGSLGKVDRPGWETIFSDRTHPSLRYLEWPPLGVKKTERTVVHGDGRLQEDALLQTTMTEGTRGWRSSDRKSCGFTGHRSLAACS